MMTFQSTLPRGERRPLCVSRTNMLRFQSTLPRGERLSERSGSCFNGEFQSTLPRGERRAKKRKNCHWYVFQSTLPRGERRGWIKADGLHRNFNPRSHEGSDRINPNQRPPTPDFNPRSHEGSDSNFRQKVLFSLSKNCLKYLILTTNYFN